jgi:hypothetical protein
MFEFPVFGRPGHPLPREHPLEGEAEVLIPQRIEADPPILPTANQAGVVAIAAGDEVKGPCDSPGFTENGTGHLLEQGCRGQVNQSVDVADVQGVDVKLPEPPQRAFDEIAPHLVTVGPVEVDAPVRAREVRPEGCKGIPLDSRLEERNPQQDGEALPVAGIDEALQPRRSSQGRRDGTGQA